MKYGVQCAFCRQLVDAESDDTWHRVEGWERKGKAGGSDIALRKRLYAAENNMFAHDHCVRREQQGIPALQETLA